MITYRRCARSKLEEKDGVDPAEQGHAILDGLDRVAVAMTPTAARQTAQRLIAAAEIAAGQSSELFGPPTMSRHAQNPFAMFGESLTLSLKLAETMIASSAVIGARSKIIDHAITSPATAELPELWQMVSEKVLAFSDTWLSLWMGGLALSRFAAVQGQDAQRLMSSGRTILPSDMLRLAVRSSRAGADLLRSGGKALAPIHKAATGNARRLHPEITRI